MSTRTQPSPEERAKWRARKAKRKTASKVGRRILFYIFAAITVMWFAAMLMPRIPAPQHPPTSAADIEHLTDYREETPEADSLTAPELVEEVDDLIDDYLEEIATTIEAQEGVDLRSDLAKGTKQQKLKFIQDYQSLTPEHRRRMNSTLARGSL